eukprot:CAMPEP_0172541734 /NCGR_PEP_ID=MMETSP1067-20121228/12503_1 /TAXON_ID=265564 ORGANISM="Thalassiosira punctigera, Strain Tpunct2005C2" /NCGR_SAMPLE_ID=MMETSP1067 /ASSEMBLY_ACC=CAM_ASM_000444 /LENGTH=46 /DNA_ID= /DNA_START= /DNA_END= /DNA_ORIENTATION=
MTRAASRDGVDGAGGLRHHQQRRAGADTPEAEADEARTYFYQQDDR